MMAGMIADVLLREVPKHLAAGVESGALNLFGSVIRDTSTGQIAGFLQEAAPLAKIISSPLTGVVDLAMDAGQLVQGELLRQGMVRLEQGVAALSQLASINLALSAAGIGVSVAGFAVLAHRIGRVQKTVDGLAGKIDVIGTKIDQVRQDLIDADLAELKALAKSLDEAWSFASGDRAERQWHDVAKGALSQQERFEFRAEHILRVDRDYALADPMFDAVAFANSLRVAALAACNESNAAHDAAADGAKTIERLTGDIGAAELVRSALAEANVEAGTPEWDRAFSEAKDNAAPTVQRIRQREAAIATRTAPLAALEAQGIAPRVWLAAAREEAEAPILLMLPPNEERANPI
jgi:hypothetical protein